MYYLNFNLKSIYYQIESVLCEEEWIDIKGFEGLYKISNLGRIKSSKRKINTHLGFRIKRELILKQKIHPSGYLYINLNKESKQSTFKVHRLVAFHFIINPLNKPEVNHKEGNKLDNRYFMLEWNTAKENSFHKNNNLKKNNLRWKLTAIDVNIIRKNSNINKQVILNLFHISKPHLHKILSNKSWTKNNSA